MTSGAGMAIWCGEVVVVAALSARPIGARLGLLLSVLLLPVPAFVTAPPIGPRLLLAAAIAWCLVRAADLALERPPRGFGARLVHLVAIIDTRLVTRRPRGFEARSAVRLVLAAAVAIGAVSMVRMADGFAGWPHYAMRWFAGGIMAFAAFEMAGALINVVTAWWGLSVPPVNDAPYRARSVSEFWAKRWNLVMTRILRDRAFRPLARRGAGAALFASFALSAVIHAYCMGVALGALCALSWGAFLLAQPLIIVAERRLGVRRWPHAVGWLWTAVALAVLSPLFTEPALRLLE